MEVPRLSIEFLNPKWSNSQLCSADSVLRFAPLGDREFVFHCLVLKKSRQPALWKPADGPIPREEEKSPSVSSFISGKVLRVWRRELLQSHLGENEPSRRLSGERHTPDALFSPGRSCEISLGLPSPVSLFRC